MRRAFCEVAGKPGLVATLTLNPCLDEAIETDRLRLDAPSPAHRRHLVPGGQGIHVARTLHRLKAPTIAYGPIAGWNGDRLAELLEAEGLPHCLTPVPGETRVHLSLSCRTTGNRYQLDVAGPALRTEDITLLLADLGALQPKPAFWVLGGSLPPGAPDNTYAVAIRQAHRVGIPVILDAAGAPLRLGVQAGPYLIAPDRHELTGLVGRELASQGDLLVAAHELLDASGIQLVLVTLGAQGALAVGRTEAWALTPPAATPLGPAGAATVAGLVRALVMGEKLSDASRYAVAVGSAAALVPAGDLARPEDIQRLLPMVKIERLAAP